MSDRPEADSPRRDFLATAAWWTTAGALTFAAVGIARMPKAAVTPGPPSAVKIGMPGEYPVSAEPMRVPGRNLFVVHDAAGFSVLGAVCSHLGCVVAPNPRGFECPCHGSLFTTEGRVVQGPAPSPLPWFELSLAADGQIVVDTHKTVPVGTRFTLS